MAKFNKKSTSTKPTEVNEMGERAYKMSSKEELVATVLTSFLQDSYYESEGTQTDRIKQAIKEIDDPYFVAQLALYARKEANMRSVSHLLAGELTDYVSQQEWADRFFEKVVVRPDDISEIVSYLYKTKGKKFRNSMKRGFSKRISRFDAYQLDKYKMKNRDVSMVDLINLFHPKPKQSNAKAFEAIINGEDLSPLYESKIWEKEVTKAGKVGETKKDRDESVDSAMTDVIDTNVDNMPVFNLIRNLRNIIIRVPDKVDDVVSILKNDQKIWKSKLFPYRFAMAYEEVSKLGSSHTTSRNKVTFEDERPSELTKDGIGKVLDALEYAMEVSCKNIPKLQGRTAILIDHSGSMRGDSGGSSLTSAFSKVNSATIANLFGTMLMQYQDNVFFGLFGDRLIIVDDINRKNGILKNSKMINDKGSKCGESSENGLFEFFEDVVKNKTQVDNVFVFSDQVIGRNGWYGIHSSTRSSARESGSFDDLFRSFRKINPYANVVTVDIRNSGGKTVFNKNLGVTQMSGWSNKIFDLLDSFSTGYKDLIKEIEKIKI